MSCTRAAASQAVCKQTPGHLPSCLPPKHSCWAPSQLQPSGEGIKAPLLTLLLAAKRRLGNLGTLLAPVRKGEWKKQPDLLPVAGSSFSLVVGGQWDPLFIPQTCVELLHMSSPGPDQTLGTWRGRHSSWSIEAHTLVRVDGHVHSQVHCGQKQRVVGAQQRDVWPSGRGSEKSSHRRWHWAWCLQVSLQCVLANQSVKGLAQLGRVWSPAWWGEEYEGGGDEGRGWTGTARLWWARCSSENAG